MKLPGPRSATMPASSRRVQPASTSPSSIIEIRCSEERLISIERTASRLASQAIATLTTGEPVSRARKSPLSLAPVTIDPSRNPDAP